MWESPRTSAHRLQLGLPGVSNPVRSPSFRPSASEETQKAAFATGVPDDINAFHRSTISSAFLYLPLALWFEAQFHG